MLVRARETKTAADRALCLTRVAREHELWLEFGEPRLQTSVLLECHHEAPGVSVGPLDSGLGDCFGFLQQVVVSSLDEVEGLCEFAGPVPDVGRVSEGLALEQVQGVLALVVELAGRLVELVLEVVDLPSELAPLGVECCFERFGRGPGLVDVGLAKCSFEAYAAG